MDVVNNPEDPAAGTRKVPFSRELYIEQDDFREDPPKKFFRLAPGREVRLRYAYFITCTGVVKDRTGEVVELRCTYDPATRGGDAPDGRKVKATMHWVSAAHAVDAEVRLYDRLFTSEKPGKSGDYHDELNPASLEVLTDARSSPRRAAATPGTRFQFERLGYFSRRSRLAPGAPVFNRTVTLKDSWARVESGKRSPSGENHGLSGGSCFSGRCCYWRSRLAAALELIAQSLIRGRLTRLEETVEAQNDAIEALERRLRSSPSPKRNRQSEVLRPPVAAPVVPPPAPTVTPPVVAAPGTSSPPPVARRRRRRCFRRHRRGSEAAGRHHPAARAAGAVRLGEAGRRETVLGDRGHRARPRRSLLPQYSIDHGWLAPPVRVIIGIIVAIALLVMCELKAARRYPVTANALDAAAIAILFATFFAAHALWNLIPADAAFALLALVTGVAVLLSIRRDSLFIAVLGLLGGFATPALLSTGENRPIPLFAYLLLLNVGLAWVASGRSGRGSCPDAGADRDLPVGLGRQVPLLQPAAAGDGHLPVFGMIRSRR